MELKLRISLNYRKRGRKELAGWFLTAART